MHKTIILTGLLLLLSAAAVFAGDEPIEFGGWGGLSIGASYLDLSDLNDFLDPVNFEKISSWRPYVGLAGHAIIFEKIVLGGRGGFSQVNADDNDIELQFNAGWGQFEVGYAVLNGRYGVLAPLLGIGGYGYNLTLDGPLWRLGHGLWEHDNADSIASGGRAIDKTPGKVNLSTGGLHSFIGVTYLYPVRFAQSEEGGFGMFLSGVTVGGTLQLLESGWRFDDGDELMGGPDIPFNTFFAVINIAFGGGTIIK